MITLTSALLCLSLNVYHEARGEPLDGQIAVAEVTMIRAAGSDENVCKEVAKPKQFSWANQLPRRNGFLALPASMKPKETAAWARARAVAEVVMTRSLLGMKPLFDATHFHVVGLKPEWSSGMQRVTRIGNHVFYRSRPGKSAYNPLAA